MFLVYSYTLSTCIDKSFDGIVEEFGGTEMEKFLGFKINKSYLEFEMSVCFGTVAMQLGFLHKVLQVPHMKDGPGC